MSYNRGEHIELVHTGNIFTVEKICKGGMGIVYIAKRQRDGKLYALKTLRDDKVGIYAYKNKISMLEARDELTKQFEWESQVWIVLGKHKNIVQAHWFDLSRNYEPFLVMEYVLGAEYGTTVGEWIDKKKAQNIDIPLVLWMCIQALTGLIYAKKVVNEELKIPFVHRDIKPGNLFISEGDTLRVKVSDFGIVKAFDASDRIIGTPYYMPPEQWEGQEVQEKTDVYALGCTMYEMITGKTPFEPSLEEERVIDKISYLKEKHMKEKPPPLKGIPQELNGLILKCLNKNNVERFSFRELRDELQSLHEKIVGQRVKVKDEPELFSAEDWNGRGVGFHRLGFHEKALRCYNEAIALCPYDARFYLNRGNAYFHLKQLKKAIESYRRAIELEPSLIEGYISIASVLCKMKQYQEALDFYDKAERLMPENAMVCWGRGIVYAEMQKYGEAIEAFEKALGINEQLAEAWLGLGNICVCLGDYNEAERCYKKAVSIKPGYAFAYQGLAQIYEYQGCNEDLEKVLARLAKRESHVKEENDEDIEDI